MTHVTQSVELSSRRNMIFMLYGSATIFIALGLRHGFGMFLDPFAREVPGITREVYGFAFALQNLLWGIGQPLAGAIADRYGSGRVIAFGGVLYAAGLALAAFSEGPMTLYLTMGVMVGFGLSCTSYAVVLGAVGRQFPPEKRSSALGLTSVGGSIGMFCAVPFMLLLIESWGLKSALLSIAAIAGLMVLTSTQLKGRSAGGAGTQTFTQALGEAFGHRGYVLLLLGFFVCGFQLAFTVGHMPAYLIDEGLPSWAGGAALTIIGGVNILGTYICGFLGDRYSKKRLLAFLYFMRGSGTLWFMLTPPSTTTLFVFAVIMGFTWLGTVPLTTGIVAQVFGPRYLATLVGLVFLTHQLGSFLGAWMGGISLQFTGSYDAVWYGIVALTFIAALIHLPINERPLTTRVGAA